MSKRLQVILEDSELREIQKIAKQNRMTVAEWVRQALRSARAGESSGDPALKLEAVRKAVRHEFPTADIGQMLDEIQKGYLESRE
jgi:hypothetical protein